MIYPRFFQVENVQFRELNSVPNNLSPGQLSWHPDSQHIIGVAWSNQPWAKLYPESANRDTALFLVNVETNKYAAETIRTSRHNCVAMFTFLTGFPC